MNSNVRSVRNNYIYNSESTIPNQSNTESGDPNQTIPNQEILNETIPNHGVRCPK